jgi:hypothetical protein
MRLAFQFSCVLAVQEVLDVITVRVQIMPLRGARQSARGFGCRARIVSTPGASAVREAAPLGQASATACDWPVRCGQGALV